MLYSIMDMLTQSIYVVNAKGQEAYKFCLKCKSDRMSVNWVWVKHWVKPTQN